MRNLGSFFGHIAKAVRADSAIEKKVVSKSVEETKQGNVTLRRTTIEEIEINSESSSDENSDSRNPDPDP